MSNEAYDVVIVGGGHNGLTAAAYLAKTGRSVLVLEKSDHLGGADRAVAVGVVGPPRDPEDRAASASPPGAAPVGRY